MWACALDFQNNLGFSDFWKTNIIFLPEFCFDIKISDFFLNFYLKNRKSQRDTQSNKGANCHHRPPHHPPFSIFWSITCFRTKMKQKNFRNAFQSQNVRLRSDLTPTNIAQSATYMEIHNWLCVRPNIIFMQKVRLLFYWISSEIRNKEWWHQFTYLSKKLSKTVRNWKKDAVHLVKCVNYLRS